MTPEQAKQLEDFAKRHKLNASVAFVFNVSVMCLMDFKEMAKRRGIKMNEITIAVLADEALKRNKL